MKRRFALAAIAWLLSSGAAVAQSFVGAGSTFAYPIIARWGQVFGTLQGEGGAYVSADANLDYEPVGSTGGIMRVIAGSVDFAATDVPMSPEELDRYNLAQFPIVSGGIAVAVNLPGIESGSLRLPGSLLAGIYLGKITRWSDPAIAAANPTLRLPDAALRVLRRADGSGTTYHFAAYLASVSEEWASRVGVDTQLAWPVGTGLRGNREVAEAVRATPGAIGYVEASQAAQAGLPAALVGNRAGRFVAPDRRGIEAGLATARWDASRHFHQALALPDDADAYPIVATVYALVPRRPTRQARATIEFFRLALTERGEDTLAAGFVPLPAPVVREVAAYWRATLRR